MTAILDNFPLLLGAGFVAGVGLCLWIFVTL